tara:strand:- start:4514 stop:4759 length:246 start_codon:yes stop_codon:yes gene_type:complete
VRAMSEKEIHIVRKPQNLRNHYYPRHRVLKYKSPVVAWTSEKIYLKDQNNETVEGIRLQPLDKRFRVNAFTGELISSTKKD